MDQIRNQFLSSENSQSRRFLDVKLEASLDRVRAGSLPIWQIFLVCSSNISCHLLCSPQADMKTAYMWAGVVLSLKFTSSYSYLVSELQEEKKCQFSNITNSERWGKKLKIFIWRVVTRHWRKLEEIRIQASL